MCSDRDRCIDHEECNIECDNARMVGRAEEEGDQRMILLCRQFLPDGRKRSDGEAYPASKRDEKDPPIYLCTREWSYLSEEVE